MKQHYRIADNAFCIEVDPELQAWRLLQYRFSPFAVKDPKSDSNPDLNPNLDPNLNPVPRPDPEFDPKPDSLLRITIRSEAISDELPGERIYEPVHQEIGLVNGAAARLVDGALVMEFSHIESLRIRARLFISPDFSRAEIILNSGGDLDDSHFLSHAVMIAYMMAFTPNGTLMMHASAVACRGKAYLFQGKSGTGKSTHSRLWLENVIGAELLNDDNPLIRFAEDGSPVAYGSPWSGKTDCYRNVAVPVGALVRIRRSDHNELRPITNPLMAYASLTPSLFFLPFFDERQRSARHRSIERLVKTAPCCEMYCRPDADAALVCLQGVLTLNSP